MAASLSASVGAGITAAAKPLTADLRAAAAKAGWDERAVRSLRVAAKERRLSVTGSSPAEAAEHGGLSTPPNPAAQRWVNKSKRLEAIVIESIAAHLTSRGVL